MKPIRIKTIFLDIGGVLLTNGWGRESRKKAIAHFRLDAAETEERHHLTFDTYEEGKLTLEEYLKRTVFYEPRSFTQEDFITFMYAQSDAYPDVIAFFKALKQKLQLRIFAVSNEGRELNAYRINRFGLNELFDAFVSSSYVHMRKPDAGIFRMAADISQTPPEQSVYIDDRLMFVEVAQSLGMHGIHFCGLEDVKEKLNAFGITAG